MKYKIWWPFSLLTSSYEKMGLYRKFGTTNIATALPAIVGAKMCVEGEAAIGVIPAEYLGPIKFLKIMADMGWPMKFHETLSKEVSIS